VEGVFLSQKTVYWQEQKIDSLFRFSSRRFRFSSRRFRFSSRRFRFSSRRSQSRL